MSCLFDSLSYFIVYDSNQIRQKICDYLEENKPLIDGLETNFILSLEDSTYVKNMRKRSQWGGGIEIQAACNLWKLRIIVFDITSKSSNKPIEFLPLTENYIYTIRLTWNGYHYEPLHP
jgi:hypothetical protein